MEYRVYDPIELDAIGEVMNISLGSSATAVSNMLNHRIDITTPTVTAMPGHEFEVGELNPSVAVEIKYVSGLEGSNIMMLKKGDVKVIVDILMGSEMDDDEFELNDFSLSAVCEVMNQMMGAASTALSDFLSRPVNISTPTPFLMTEPDLFKKDYIEKLSGTIVVVKFTLSIEGKLESEFVNIIPTELVDELLKSFGFEVNKKFQTEDGEIVMGNTESEPKQVEAAPQEQPAPVEAPPPPPPAPTPPQEQAPPPTPQPAMSDAPPQAPPPPQQPQQQAYAEVQGQPQPQMMPGQQPYGEMPVQGMYGMPPQMYGMPPQMYGMPPQGQYMYQPDPKVIDAQQVDLPALSQNDMLSQEQAQNLDLILSVPLEVSVEIGRTRRKVEEILTYSKGSLVVLDKLAGDQVDLYVNGLCIARGDVVVINDNFGVRITEVLKQNQIMEIANGKK